MNLAPSNLLELLTQEHKLISTAANYSLVFAEQLAHVPSSEALTWSQVLVQFFEQFSKTIHREKEEDLLFPAIAGSNDRGIIEMICLLRADHQFSSDILRKLSVSVLQEEQRAIDPLNVAALLTRYGTYLLQHTAREEQMFYPAVRMQINHLQLISVPATVIDQSLAAQREWEKRLGTLGQELSRHIT